TVTVTVSSDAELISNLSVASGKAYELDSSLAVGDLVYIDRSYEYTDVGSLGGEEYIRTANGDKNATDTEFLSFDVNQDVTVHLLYDNRASGLPSGFTGWTDTGEVLANTDAGDQRVWTKAFAAGTVVLPGNKAGGDTGAGSMYSVAVVPDGGTVNQAPTASDDSAGTTEGTAVTIDVLANDSDPDAGDTLTVDSVTQGANGSVTNNGSDVTYTPDAGFTGTDTFDYTAADGNGGFDTATVTVTVEATGTVQWTESFDGLADGTQNDSGETGWTTDTSNLGSNASFEVMDGQFQASDTDGVGVWQSEAIDIASAGSVSVSVDVDGAGTLDAGQDWLRVSIRVDGGSLQEIGYFDGGLTAQTITADGISGSSLEVVIEAANTGSDEFYYWDNVSVSS
ncbi:MAG: cadherin-like domain-containing protein, partial [Phycisphaerae bacterium]|nr:cadherin-like domain-containing protein [Phycisphaerae bacterium]